MDWMDDIKALAFDGSFAGFLQNFASFAPTGNYSGQAVQTMYSQWQTMGIGQTFSFTMQMDAAGHSTGGNDSYSQVGTVAHDDGNIFSVVYHLFNGLLETIVQTRLNDDLTRANGASDEVYFIPSLASQGQNEFKFVNEHYVGEFLGKFAGDVGLMPPGATRSDIEALMRYRMDKQLKDQLLFDKDKIGPPMRVVRL
jgi:hypothetical protein